MVRGLKTEVEAPGGEDGNPQTQKLNGATALLKHDLSSSNSSLEPVIE